MWVLYMTEPVKALDKHLRCWRVSTEIFSSYGAQDKSH